MAANSTTALEDGSKMPVSSRRVLDPPFKQSPANEMVITKKVIGSLIVKMLCMLPEHYCHCVLQIELVHEAKRQDSDCNSDTAAATACMLCSNASYLVVLVVSLAL